MKRLCLIVSAIVSTFTACSQPGTTCDGDFLESKATICPNAETIAFAAYVNTAPLKTLILTNESTANLSVTAVEKSGAGEFSIETSEPVPATVAGNKHLLVKVVFAPNSVGSFEGKLKVKSNAEKCAWSDGGVPADCGTLEFALTGTGVEAPDAGTP